MIAKNYFQKWRFSAPVALLLLCIFAVTKQACAQEKLPPLGLEIQPNSEANYIESNNLVIVTNGVVIRYNDTNALTTLDAREASINTDTGDVFARGSVHIQSGDRTWIGEEFHYNFQTRRLDTTAFRSGNPPFYIAGQDLHATNQGTNEIYRGTNTTLTTDDLAQPLQEIRAKRFIMVPGEYIEAHDATMWIANVPVFYFPYYRRRLKHEQNEFNFLPGYRSEFGPYLLSSYNWVWDEQLRGALHLDYREVRGLGLGPDLNYNYGEYGHGDFRYYYAHDQQPGTDPFTGANIPHDRQRAYFSYDANPLTNLTVMSQVARQTDPYIVRDFFESQYSKDIQPKTFLDADQVWQNWSLDALAQTRINPFWETVEREPDIRLSGFRQQVLDLPVFYESQSSIGYYRRLFSTTNSLNTNLVAPLDYSAFRADTWHQLTMPETFFGWLNVTPRVGARYTYYDDATGPGGTNAAHNRDVFNTGAEASFTLSRLWTEPKNELFDVDGLRHIFQPSINYVYIPQPSVLPGQLPQFDYELTNALRLLPLEYPEYNAIDSINSQNTIRYGVDNRIQTKRNGEVDDLVDWSVYVDWNLRPRNDQSTFSDIYSDFTLKPRTWLKFQSYTRYDIENGQFNLSQHSLSIEPNSTWSWTGSHIYLRSGTLFGQGDDLFSSVLFYRFDENWGTRIAHYFDANTGLLQEQDYTIYRDLRSWTAALTFRALDSQSTGHDYSVAFTFSFKSFPHFPLGSDTVRASTLVGY